MTVFGGYRTGAHEQYVQVRQIYTLHGSRDQAAFELGAALAEKKAIVVNGAGNAGLMHATLEGALSKGGRVEVNIMFPFLLTGVFLMHECVLIFSIALLFLIVSQGVITKRFVEMDEGHLEAFKGISSFSLAFSGIINLSSRHFFLLWAKA